MLHIAAAAPIDLILVLESGRHGRLASRMQALRRTWSPSSLPAAPAPSSGGGGAAPRGHHRRVHSETFLRFPDADLLLDPDDDLSFSGDGILHPHGTGDMVLVTSSSKGFGPWKLLLGYMEVLQLHEVLPCTTRRLLQAIAHLRHHPSASTTASALTSHFKFLPARSAHGAREQSCCWLHDHAAVPFHHFTTTASLILVSSCTDTPFCKDPAEMDI